CDARYSPLLVVRFLLWTLETLPSGEERSREHRAQHIMFSLRRCRGCFLYFAHHLQRVDKLTLADAPGRSFTHHKNEQHVIVIERAVVIADIATRILALLAVLAVLQI